MKYIDNHISFQEAKTLAQKVLDDECAKSGLQLSAHAIHLHEYYQSDIFKSRMKVVRGTDKLVQVMLPIRHRGVYSPEYPDTIEEHILVFADSCLLKSKLSGQHPIVELLKTCFHEITHAYQYENRLNQYRYYEEFGLFHMEDTISYFDHYFYLKNHDSFYKEIDANIRGMRQASSYLKKNYPHIYSLEKKYLDQRISQYELELQNYLFDVFLEKIYDIYSTNPSQFYSNSHDAFYPYPSLFCQFQSSHFKSVHEVITTLSDYISQEKQVASFFDSDGPSLDDIYQLFFSFITSHLYLKNLNISSLSLEEKKFMMIACDYSLKIEQNKIDSFKGDSRQLDYVYQRIELLHHVMQRLQKDNHTSFIKK